MVMMKVYLLDTGTLLADKGGIVYRGGDAPKETVRLPVPAVLIDHPQGKILYDTGCHPDAMKGYWPQNMQRAFPLTQEPSQRLERQLALCNTTPGEIKTVVISHLHLDHLGGIYLFPHADVYAPKADFLHALSETHRVSDPERHGGYIKNDLEQPVKEYHLIEGDYTLAPGVELLSLPGHTPGLLGMLVQLDCGTLLFPQDAVYTAENYGPPAVPARSPYDRELLLASIERVRRLQKEYGAKVFFPHDWDFWQTVRRAPQFYE
ncbi:glyoxylase-like metal-dependent hydrolase (beta-lactamase superfamily II) [Harryflintia acetispora]|uniref:Glyoxylase-like metal-dependent hydrolase (Beta-lactamase superfamily II) n=2 Tax=Harryflintia acetispora TaxID=1849041 RepID=A0A9X8UKM7_9FIRM|nr:glyoxylase-like metal-dependent hydrolase (beta-lactamase superfamily II) [Harryflintia acetispora]